MGRPSDLWEKNLVIDVGDIQIGAVEVKDGTTDTRAVVGSGGLEVKVKTMASMVTIGASPNFIGLATVVHGSNVTLNASSAFIGLATVVHGSNVTLNASSAFIGLVSCASVHASTDLKTLMAGEDQTNDVLKTEQQFSYGRLTAASTVAIKGSAGFLHAFSIGMPSCPTIIFYDNTVPSGTVLHKIAAGHPQGTHLLDVKFTTGLSLDAIVSGGGVLPEVTVSYR